MLEVSRCCRIEIRCPVWFLFGRPETEPVRRIGRDHPFVSVWVNVQKPVVRPLLIGQEVKQPSPAIDLHWKVCEIEVAGSAGAHAATRLGHPNEVLESGWEPQAEIVNEGVELPPTRSPHRLTLVEVTTRERMLDRRLNEKPRKVVVELPLDRRKQAPVEHRIGGRRWVFSITRQVNRWPSARDTETREAHPITVTRFGVVGQTDRRHCSTGPPFRSDA